LEYPMPYTFRAIFPALCLTLILPCSQLVMAADPAPDKDAKTADAPVERAALPSRSEEDTLALERQVPPVEQQQLQAGDEAFLALWKPANIAEPKGAVIIVPGADESADWPNAVGPMRRKLPDVGWSSLSLSMPDAHNDGIFARAAEAPATPSAGDKQLKQTRQKPMPRKSSPGSTVPLRSPNRTRPAASSSLATAAARTGRRAT
jgi:hypothetical protein